LLLETRGLSKRFGQQYALKQVNLQILPGEIHGLVGENGAGKSTLIKILTGVYTRDEGQVLWEGKEVSDLNPVASRRLGINVIHQDRHLIPQFNAVENVYLGLEYETRGAVAIDWKQMRSAVERIMQELSIELPLNVPAMYLTPPQKTLVEIIRGMMTDCKLFILDEPTASLTDKETDILFDLILKLKQKGTSVLYVSHRMEEIFRLTDRITVLKNGELVSTVQTSEVDLDGLVALMTDNWQSRKRLTERRVGAEVLRVNRLASVDQKVKDASFVVREGEILGIFGLGGSGRTELLETIYGLRKSARGEVVLSGEAYEKRTPRESLKRGMVLISEDRRGQALIESLTVRKNVVLSTLDRYARVGVMDGKREIRDTEGQIRALDIKTKGVNQVVKELSGGNQQKVVFAKALLAEPKVFLCDEPTQGVDIRTREEIHNLLRAKAEEGKTVVFVSSDLQEMLDVVDTFVILTEGRTTHVVKNEDLTSEQVLSYCYAGTREKESSR
jgi:ribose transport system ATP-binding protein